MITSQFICAAARLARSICVAASLLVGAHSALADTKTNATSIGINDRPATTGPSAAATVYPSVINFSGLPGTVTSVSLTLNGVTMSRPRDLDILLVAPDGTAFIVMSDAGGLQPISGVNITLTDSAATLLPGDTGGLNDVPITTGSYKPTAAFFSSTSEPDSFPSPAPAPPSSAGFPNPAPTGSSTFGSIFTGKSPNGDWKLYIVDDSLGGGNATTNFISGGWTLTVNSSSGVVATTTALASSVNPSFTGSAVTFTATVSPASGSTTPTGTVTFSEGTTTLAANISLNASGQAAFTTSTLTEGSHVITATYNPTGSFTTSNTTLTQVVNNPTQVSGNQFTNPGTITAFNENPGGIVTTPYPSNIFVNLSGIVTKVTLRLNNLTAPRPNNLDILLVGPGGQKFVVMSDVGSNGVNGPAANNINLVLEDSAAGTMPTGDTSSLVGGTFRPTDFNPGVADSFPSPAPAAPYNSPAPNGTATFASTFNGINPTGTWSLYVTDDSLGGGSNTIGSWSLTILTSATEVPTTTTVTSSANPSLTGSAVTFTATVRNANTNAPVTTGTVRFYEGATTLAAAVALNASGQATFMTSSLTEGNHVIGADFSGVAGSFSTSTGGLTQVANNPTVINGNQFTNPGAITSNDQTGTVTSPYPSNIFVSGLLGTITKVTLTLNNATLPRPRDLDILLVGPAGQKFVPISDVGDLTQATGITLVLDDAAASALPTGANSVIAGGTFRPTDFNSGTDTFPSPAPTAPYNSPAPNGTATFAGTFNGANPNGTWSLYVTDDNLGGGANVISGGWALAFQTNATPPAITSGNSATYTVGTNGSFTVSGTGIPAPTYSTAGPLPSGVTLSSAGLLSGTPAAGTAGTYNFSITASNGVSPNATQSFTLRVTTSATNYIAGFGLSGGNAAYTFDFDGDGISNLLEYALGLNPTTASLLGLPVVTVKDYSGTQYLSMTFLRSSAATDLTYIVQASGDLSGAWTDVAMSAAGGATSGPGFVTESAAGTNVTVEVRDTVPLSSGNPTQKRSLRLKVTSP